MSDNESKLVYVLPRVRIVSGDAQQKVVNVGKAQFWPDEDDIGRMWCIRPAQRGWTSIETFRTPSQMQNHEWPVEHC